MPTKKGDPAETKETQQEKRIRVAAEKALQDKKDADEERERKELLAKQEKGDDVCCVSFHNLFVCTTIILSDSLAAAALAEQKKSSVEDKDRGKHSVFFSINVMLTSYTDARLTQMEDSISTVNTALSDILEKLGNYVTILKVLTLHASTLIII